MNIIFSTKKVILKITIFKSDLSQNQNILSSIKILFPSIYQLADNYFTSLGSISNVHIYLLFENKILKISDFGFTGIDYNERSDSIIAPKKFSIQDFMQENLVWAVQKKRRSIEKRLSRKYGQLDGYYKLIIKQKDLEVCVHCGHDKKRGYLCSKLENIFSLLPYIKNFFFSSCTLSFYRII